MNEDRIAEALACHDADDVPKVENAGEIITVSGKECQVMHNGVLIYKKWPHAQASRIFNTHLPDVILHREGVGA